MNWYKTSQLEAKWNCCGYKNVFDYCCFRNIGNYIQQHSKDVFVDILHVLDENYSYQDDSYSSDENYTNSYNYSDTYNYDTDYESKIDYDEFNNGENFTETKNYNNLNEFNVCKKAEEYRLSTPMMKLMMQPCKRNHKNETLTAWVN